MSRVFQMVEGPAHLMQPRVMLKVLMRQLQHQLNFTGSGQRDAPASSASGAGTTEASGTGLAGLGRISPARARVLTGDKGTIWA